MKILLIHNQYQTNNIGGEDIVYQNELQLLQQKLGTDNVFSYVVYNDNINKFKLLTNIWFSKKTYNDIKNMININHIDLVHIHNFYPLLTPSVFAVAKEAGAKVVHTLHNYRLWCIAGTFYQDNYGICELCTKYQFSLQGILNKCFRKSFIQSVLAQLSFWYYQKIKVFDNIDYFFVLTQFQKDKVISLGLDEKKIILKPNSVEFPIDTNIDIDNINKNGYIYVGRLEESKGIIELLKVWQNLDNNFVLTIIGNGIIEAELKKTYHQKNIIFVGKCTRKDTLKMISQSKYLIQPSILYETFGLTIIEAMRVGVPVIGFDIGTRKNLITDEVNGFLSKRENLASVIKKSYQYKQYKMLSNNAIANAKNFENIGMINKQIAIYQNIINR